MMNDDKMLKIADQAVELFKNERFDAFDAYCNACKELLEPYEYPLFDGLVWLKICKSEKQKAV